jgi:hypothetical protein
LNGLRSTLQAELLDLTRPTQFKEQSMNILKVYGAIAVLCSGAGVLAQSAEPARVPRLTFRTIPVEQVSNGEHKVTPYRIFDTLIVTVWDPISCGQRPSDAAAEVKGDKVLLSYKLSAPTSDTKGCTLVSEFDVAELPNRDLEVHFAGGPEPYTVAKMKKCPSYQPKSADIWECLMPQKP